MSHPTLPVSSPPGLIASVQLCQSLAVVFGCSAALLACWLSVSQAERERTGAGISSASDGCVCACALPTDLAVADVDGNVVEMTQTINGLFGCGAMVPGTGIMLNNTQNMFDPHPDMPHSVAPGKRVTSSMAPTIVLHPDGSPFFAVSQL